MAFFSVIVPIYNADKYLDKCLLSIINQSFSDFELVLVDDGSTDESFSVYYEYQKKDKRIIIVKKEKNEGLVCARDSGLEICSGEYVCWVDADDYIDLDRLQRIYDVIVSSDADIVLTGWIWENPDGKKRLINDSLAVGIYKESDYECLKPSIMHFNKQKTNRMVSPNLWSKVIRRNLFQITEKKVPPKIRIGEDAMRVYPAFLCADSLAVISDNSYHYVQHRGQMTRKYYADYYENALKIYDFIKHINKDNNLCKYSIEEALFQNYCHVSSYGVVSAFGSHRNKKERKKAIRAVCDEFGRRGLNNKRYVFEFFYNRWILEALSCRQFKILYVLAFLYCKFM